MAGSDVGSFATARTIQSLLFDVQLPADGTYYVEVDTFAGDPNNPAYNPANPTSPLNPTNTDSILNPLNPSFDPARLSAFLDTRDDRDTGDYELFLYRFGAANAVDLGLSAGVWSENVHLALETARRLEAGYVWVNDANRHYPNAPYGGMKNSGVGREESAEELLSYLETKSTHVRTRAAADVLSEQVDIHSGTVYGE